MSITAETRLESYDLIQVKAPTRKKAILNYLNEKGPHTAEEIMSGMGFSDPNRVRPRLSEMKKDGLVKNPDKLLSPRTGRKTAIWEAVSHGES